MALIPTSEPRYEVLRSQTEVRVVIPARRNWFLVFFLICWLGAWGFGETTAFRQLVTGQGRNGASFMMFWLAGWTLGGAFAAGSVLWMLNGREIVSIRPDISRLGVRSAIGNVAVRTREFDLSQVRNLRVTNAPYNPYRLDFRQSSWGSLGSAIAFDYGSRTFHFGVGLDEAELQMLLQVLKD
jgi:hypothetical protein